MVSNMKKIEIINTDELIYYEKLENGLEVYMLPNNNIKKYAISFFTKFGSIHTSFKSNNNKYTVPNGIAHFLEHKVFEQKNGIDPFTFFSKSGTDCNAYTAYNYTNYILDGTTNLNKNINYLLDYVQSPNFTNENVEKEKGIIKQELLSYKDYYEYLSFDNLMSNIFINSNYKYTVGGEVEDIEKITKNMLYDCYNAFYNPNNMIIVITGNFNKDKIIEIIKNNQMNKVFNNYKYEIQSIDEPDKVLKEFDKLTIGVSIPILNIGIKIKKEDNIKDKLYLLIIVDYLFGKTSKFVEKLIEDNIIEGRLKSNIVDADTHDVILLECKSYKYEETIKRVKSLLNNFEIDNVFFERRKKVSICKYIECFEYINKINFEIVDYLIEYGKYPYDYYEIIKSLDYKELCDIKNRLCFDNMSSYVID